MVATNGMVTARVVDPGTGEVVGGYAGAQTMPLVRFQAEPGQSVTIPLLVGTASSVPELGYAVPPGSWAIDAVLKLEDGTYRTPRFPLTVTA